MSEQTGADAVAATWTAVFLELAVVGPVIRAYFPAGILRPWMHAIVLSVAFLVALWLFHIRRVGLERRGLRHL